MTKEEFQKQVIPIGDRLYRIALRIVGNAETAKDVLQESYLKLWEKRNELHNIISIEAFACTMIKNRCLDILRLQKDMVNVDLLKSMGSNPEADLDNLESVAEVRKLMQMLPDRQRLIMQMRDIDCCTFEEIALIVDTSVNNVRVQLCIARKWIKEELMKVYNYGIPGN